MIEAVIPKLHATVKRHPALARLARRALSGGRSLVDSARAVSGRGIPRPTQSIGAVELPDAVPGATYQEIERPRTLHRQPPSMFATLPRSIYEGAATTTTVPLFVVQIPNGRAYGQMVVATPDNRLVSDLSRTEERGVSPEGRTRYGVTLPQLLPKPRRLDGRVAVLTDYAALGYFHWMTEVVPRLELLAHAGIPLESIDWFVVNATASSFQRETLAHLGVPSERIVQSLWTPHIEADELIVPSHFGDVRDPHPFVASALRSRFGPPVGQLHEGGKRVRLYLSREETTHRRLTNEAEVQRRCEERGFTIIVPERLTLHQKADLFARAEIIAGPTGAAFTHIAFCLPGTKVVELVDEREVTLVFWALSNQLGLEYFAVPTLLSGGTAQRTKPRDLSIDLQVLDAALDRVIQDD